MTERISYVEIDLNRCSEVYGVGACTASIPTTGTDKCFNCYATCQDKANYNKETVTSRHSTASGTLPLNIDAVPDLASVSIRPAQLDLGESIGVRASVTVTFKDARYPDTGPEGDRYLSDRNYDPYTQGSYWGKFRARYPFIQGADIRLIRGSSDQTLAQMETRHFIVDNVSGPDSAGTFTIVCKDALKLADSKKAQSPILSQGELSSTLPISGPLAITLSPTGIGAKYKTGAEFPTRGYINIGGEEIVAFSNPSGSDTLQISGRGSLNTEAKEHDAGTRVQLCTYYSPTYNNLAGWKPTDIIKDLLVNYAGVPESYIPIADWNLEDSEFIVNTYSAVIAEPESVTDLINELLQQTASTIWWDDVNKLMQFRVLKAVNTDAALYDDNLILAGSFSAKDQNSKRVSQVWTYFGQINPLEGLKDGKNYSRTQANISIESEDNFENVPSIKRIYSRWISEGSRPTAERLNLTILSRYSTPPRLVSWQLQRDFNLTVPQLAGGYNVRNRNTQNAKGEASVVPVQITQLKSSDKGFTIIGEEVLYSETIAPPSVIDKLVPIEDSENGIDLRDKAIKSNRWPANDGDVWTFAITTGSVIGSKSTTEKAITTGIWPENVTLKIINNSTIAGKGGAGGQGGGLQQQPNGNNFWATAASAGEDGGDAIEILHDIEIENNGIIAGGGGGGGGGGSSTSLSQFAGTGNGGGAGAGAGASLGGNSGVNTYSFPEHVTGNNGSSNTVSNGGLGGAEVFYDAPSSFPTLVCPKGGAGGDLDQAGASGADGYITPSSSPYDVPPFIGLGAAGGQPGAAINKNGFNVIITGTNPVTGIINP